MCAPDGRPDAGRPRSPGATGAEPTRVPGLPLLPAPALFGHLTQVREDGGLSGSEGVDLRPECATVGREGARCDLGSPLHARQASAAPTAGAPRAEAATSGVASGTARRCAWPPEGGLSPKRRGPGFPRLRRPAGERPPRPGLELETRREYGGRSRGAPGPVNLVGAASQQAWPPPPGRLCAGWGRWGRGRERGGAGGLGPAAFPGIRWRHSLPPPVGRVPGWERAASYWSA